MLLDTRTILMNDIKGSILYSKANAFQTCCKEKGESSSGHAKQNEKVRVRIYIYSMAVKGVDEARVK